jgi:hypothetical protein
VADPHSLRRRSIAFGIAIVLALGAAAFLVYCLRERDDARAELAQARVQLRRARATSSNDAQHLDQARHAVPALRDQLTTVANGAQDIGKLDDQDLAAVRAAVQSGLAGNLDAYNAAVDQRTTLDPEHDTALEQLRQRANAVITALDQLTG